MPLLLLLSTFLLISCSKPETSKAIKATKTNVESTVSSVNSGTVRAEKISELAFGAVGRVKKLNVKLGDIVKKDQVLAELENEDLETAYKNAEREAQRQKAQLENKSTSKLAFDSSNTSLEATRMALERSYIKAPFDGIISELNLEVGQLSQITTELRRALMRIVDTQSRFVRFEIDEVDYAKITIGMPVRVKILAERRDPFMGTIRKIVPFVSSAREQDRTTEVEVNVHAEEKLLIAGASADIDIITNKKENVLAIPSRAILGRGQERHVFVAQNGKAKKVLITLGLSNYDRSEVISGLSENDNVLIPSDKNELADGMKVSVELEAWPS